MRLSFDDSRRFFVFRHCSGAVGENVTTNQPNQPNKIFNQDIAKYVADFHKHLTTLSTGTLVLLSSFVDKLFHTPKWKALVVVTMLGLLSTIVCCIYSYWLHLSSVEKDEKLGLRQKRLDDLLGFCMILSFTGAIACLVIFFIRNYAFS
jgi:hypothetical protein